MRLANSPHADQPADNGRCGAVDERGGRDECRTLDDPMASATRHSRRRLVRVGARRLCELRIAEGWLIGNDRVDLKHARRPLCRAAPLSIRRRRASSSAFASSTGIQASRGSL